MVNVKTKEIGAELIGPGGLFSKTTFLYLRDEPRTNNNMNTLAEGNQDSFKLQMYKSDGIVGKQPELAAQIFLDEANVAKLVMEGVKWLARKTNTEQ